ncbi:S-adenosyl-L-methionine-dependent methyltransferase [Meredithblackwellia eburnea MCA 4105]
MSPPEHDHDHVHDHSHQEHGHDYVQANKDHHNQHGHAHSHSNSPLNNFLAESVADSVLEIADFDENATTLLDFACGSGLVSQRLAPHCKRIVGVDLSQAMVDHFNQLVADHGIEKEEMVAIQRDELKDDENELDGELFDVVLCAQAYHHIPDVDAVTLALSRRVKPQGKLIVIDLDSTSGFADWRNRVSKESAEKYKKVVAHKNGFAPEELISSFEKTGRFSSVTTEVTLTTSLRQLAEIKGPNNWAEGMQKPDEGEKESKKDLEIRHLAWIGVKK